MYIRAQGRPVHQTKSRKRRYSRNRRYQVDDTDQPGSDDEYIHGTSFLFLFLFMKDALDFPKERGWFLPQGIEPT